MKKKLVRILGLTLAIVLVLTPAAAVLAYTWEYYTDFSVENTSASDQTAVPVLTTMEVDNLIAAGRADAGAMGVRITEVEDPIHYMLASNKTGLFIPSLLAYQTRNFREYTGYIPDATDFDIITGTDGYITIADDDTLEPGSDFETEQKGWVDTDAGADKNLVYKEDAFRIFIDGATNITAKSDGDDSFNPDADVEVTSVDGNVRYDAGAVGDTWDEVHDALDADLADDDGNIITVGWNCDEVNNNRWDDLWRGYLLFDTSSLPDAATVTSATIAIYGTNKWNQRPWGDLTWNVFSSNPATDTALVTTDYDQVGAVPFATAITYADYNAAGWNTFTLNAAGLAAIEVADVSKFSIREATYDAPDVRPTWSDGNMARVDFESADNAGNLPVLTVEWTQVEVTATGISSGEHIIKTVLHNNVFSIQIDEDVPFTTAAVGVTVPANNNDWILNQNNVMPYMEYFYIWR